MKAKAARRGKGAALPPKLESNGLIQKEIRTLDDADKEKAAGETLLVLSELFSWLMLKTRSLIEAVAHYVS